MTGNTPSVITTLLQLVEISIVLRLLHTKYLIPYSDIATTLLCKLVLKLVYKVGFYLGTALPFCGFSSASVVKWWYLAAVCGQGDYDHVYSAENHIVNFA